ncbi:uncharacterized protein TRIADDRAFT_62457 [Trichoplax adhaerens]|uniref:Uncharacterized protein n=1 Tax=Trichoplax adhaerens TaxID=10228 RepID=B3SDV0_TRIAD|nr:predicted protein [Trichoplax adhaerens]EDV19098.1 predicted protein [Trichoplax adhaerens]|eukprot:XP_002118421.1 predicted protein [Trichoplax adhaerens]
MDCVTRYPEVVAISKAELYYAWNKRGKDRLQITGKYDLRTLPETLVSTTTATDVLPTHYRRLQDINSAAIIGCPKALEPSIHPAYRIKATSVVLWGISLTGKEINSPREEVLDNVALTRAYNNNITSYDYDASI